MSILYKIFIIYLMFGKIFLGVPKDNINIKNQLPEYLDITLISTLKSVLNKSLDLKFQMLLRYQHKEGNSIFLYDSKGKFIELEYRKNKWDTSSFPKVSELIHGELYRFFFVLEDLSHKTSLIHKSLFLIQTKEKIPYYLGFLRKIENEYIKTIRF